MGNSGLAGNELNASTASDIANLKYVFHFLSIYHSFIYVN